MTPSIISKHLTPASFPVSSGLCRGTRLRGPTWHVPYTQAQGWCSESGLPSIHRQTASEKSFAKTDMSHDMTKPTKWVCAQQRLSSAWASTLTDQGIHPVWSVFAVHSMGSKDPRFIHADSEDWSDWADAQADLSLHWAHRSFCWFCHVAAHIEF